MKRSASPLSTLRRPLVWLLVLATLAYGPSSVLAGLLGPTHVHRAVDAGPGPWDAVVEAFAGLRAWRAGLHQRLLPHAHGPEHGHAHDAAGAHAHAHASWQRHHHAPQDGSVVALDGAAGQEAASPAAGGSAALPLALAPPPGALPERSAVVRAWHRAPDARWSDAPPRTDVPPPRA